MSFKYHIKIILIKAVFQKPRGTIC